MIKDTHYRLTLDCLAAASPWWLLLCIPAACLLMFWLYQRQVVTLRRSHRLILLSLRLVTVALVVFLLFRPRLQLERLTEYGGRFLMVVDNSLSMGIRDLAIQPERAAGYARRTGLLKDASPFHEAQLKIDELRRHVRGLLELQQGAFQENDRYWKYTEARRGPVDILIGALTPQADEAGRECLIEVRSLFGGAVTDPGAVREGTRKLLGQLGKLRERFAEREMKADSAVTGPPVTEVMGWTRLELIRRFLSEDFIRSCEKQVERQSFEIRPLHGGASEAWKAQAGGSDVLGALRGALAEEHKMPLSGIILISDGRQNSGNTGVATVTELFRDRAVPIYTLGVGSTGEPPDLAILQVEAPEFAVQGQPVHLGLRLKAVPAAEALKTVTVTATRGDKTLATFTLEPQGRREFTAGVELALDAVGVADVTLSLTPVAGEMIEANNRQTVPIEVLERKMRVLYLEDRPHWQARFVAGILMRLAHVELNRLVTLSAPEGKLERGVGLGSWPESRAILDLYDMIVLGDVAPTTLGADEWKQVTDWSRLPGHTLVLIAGERHLPAAYTNNPLAAIMPIPIPRPAQTESVSDWALTPEGAGNRMSRAWASFLRTAPREAAHPQAATNSVCLVHSMKDGSPLLSWRRLDQGKVVLWNQPMAWSYLNGANLDAHTRLWVDLVTWSSRIRLERPGLQVDGHRSDDATPLDVLLTGAADTPLLLKHEDGQTTISLPAQLLMPGVAHYTTNTLRAGRWTLQAGGQRGVVSVHERAPEYGRVSREENFLRQLASQTDGQYVDLANIAGLAPGLEGKQARETQRYIFPVWCHGLTLALLFLLITGEWIFRKWAGKI